MKNKKFICLLSVISLLLASCSVVNRPLGASDEQYKMWQELKGQELYCLGGCPLYKNHESAITFKDKTTVDNSVGYIPFKVKICNEKDCEIYVKKAPLDTSLWLLKTQNADGRILLSDINTGKFGSWGTKTESEEFAIEYSKKLKEIEKQNEQTQKELQEWAEKISKKAGGLKWCQPSGIIDIMIAGGLPQKCLFISDGPRWKVLQQTKEGTLVSMEWADKIFFIESNKTDSILFDDDFLKPGVFTSVGKFQYLNPLGTTKTIPKLKRIETL